MVIISMWFFLPQVCLVLKWQKWQWRIKPGKALAYVVSALPVISFLSASVCKTSSLLRLTHENWMATFQTLHYTSATSQCPLAPSLFNYNSKSIEKMERMCCCVWEVQSFRGIRNRISEAYRVINQKYVSQHIWHNAWNERKPYFISDNIYYTKKNAQEKFLLIDYMLV